METISLQALLEAGCHFGHKSERWNPRAKEFIYAEKDGIHIIDLVKTKEGLDRASEYVRSLVALGGEMIFVGTKRQAKGIIKEEAERVGAPYFSERWIGGFLTNWDEIKKNIQKINRMTQEESDGSWKKFPKHEQMKMSRYLKRLKNYYNGVLNLTDKPKVLFIIDVRKENSAVREGKRCDIPIIGVVDTNSDPLQVDYAIPANDDAVGSVSLIVRHISGAYQEGKKLYESSLTDKLRIQSPESGIQKKNEEEDKTEEIKDKKAQTLGKRPASGVRSIRKSAAPSDLKEKATAKRGRPKKIDKEG